MNSCNRLLYVGRIFVLGLIIIARALAQMVLISESRSVTASYWGGGIETHSSAGTFGMFEATAVGTPFGGGSVYVYQKSNIIPSEMTIIHHTYDLYGIGGDGLSDFNVTFSLPRYTRITISGYTANYWPGLASLESQSLGTIPLIWGPDTIYRNYLNFDQVLGPGVYTFATSEFPRDAGDTTIALQASLVPEGGTSAWMLAIGLFSIVAIRRRILSRQCFHQDRI